MEQYIMGIDIGIASVGWAVLNENAEILEAGSNIFPEADAAQNADRRSFRQGRRLKRRKRIRINDFNKMWEKYGFEIDDVVSDPDVLLLRNKGLNEFLEEKELYSVLKYMLKHRGISYLEDDIDENATGDYKEGLKLNQEELRTKYPCQIQLDRIEKYNSFRGNNTVEINGKKVILSNVFTTGAYRKEIDRILETQSKYNTKLTENFIKEYREIFDRKREYYEGPGNELSRTNYGRYTLNIDPNTGKYITEDNIFEKLIGKCSVYPNEMRGAAASYTAQEFNALNDLNNLIINGRHLEEKEKRQIIDKYKSEKVVNVRKIIKSVIGEDIETMTGARVDKNDKEIFHTFEIYRKIQKRMSESGKDISVFDRDDLDTIGEILTLNTEREGIEKAFKRSPIICDEDIIGLLIDVRNNNPSLFSKWHSMSLKIMNELIPDLYEQPKNQMQLLSERDVFKSKIELFEKYKEIPVETVIKEIYNPVVKRSVSITIKVINALIKKYGFPKKIVIEMPRDKNSDDLKAKISDLQKKGENELKEIKKKIKDEYGIDITDELFRKHKGLALKLKLWNEQNGRCLYSGRSIPVDRLIFDRNLFEVDHIIPISISLDDSRNNKVLVYASENQEKGNRTPFMYLSSVNRDWGWEQYCAYVKELEKNWGRERKNKAKNLLFTENITKIDIVKGFVNRNLNDTRYASKKVLNLLQSYFAAKNSDTLVSVIRGSFTHQMRENLKIEKSRDENYYHHAVDAMLIAFSQMRYDDYRAKQKQIIDFETGEILNEKGWYNQDRIYKEILFQKRLYDFKKQVNEAESKIKIWYKVDKKCNRGLCNQTIYGTRDLNGEKYIVDSLDLYNNDDIKNLRKLIDKHKETDILMYQNDPRTFENLMQIYNDYRETDNPFVAYNRETGDFFRKYSKKHDGPKITKIKFLREKLGSCIDISHKYGYEKDSKKVILNSLNPYRMDVYYEEKTGQYFFVGLKYSDIKCIGNSYVIDEEKYRNIMVAEKMLTENESVEDLLKKGIRFVLSFYKNDIIEYEKDGKIIRERFNARIMPKVRNYIECKPLNAPKYEKRNLVGLSKTKSVRKIAKDILGNESIIEVEKLKKVVDTI
ncbi:MAG: type II CRISPR RNA-guided endonuclease Cas9 [Lachnospiraceae bacterium]|nr:type II CRISPR RNA-guided endonuclease Cas9 [Lachnospiraceae bacterium]